MSSAIGQRIMRVLSCFVSHLVEHFYQNERYKSKIKHPSIQEANHGLELLACYFQSAQGAARKFIN